MSEWSLIFEGFDPDQEKLREALCVLGNGYIATRGAAPESVAGDCHYPGTYLAGGYNRLTTEIAGRMIENEDLVNLPNWLPLQIHIDGAGWFDLHKVEILDYRQELDLKNGVLHRWLHFRDFEGQETRIALLAARASQSRIEIAMAARTHALLNGARLDIAHEIEHAKDFIVNAFAVDLEIGDHLNVDKVVSIHTSRDPAIASPALATTQDARRAPEFAGLLASHAKA